MFCTTDQLHNESDVEQKFIIAMLTAPSPQGMGFSTVDIRTKADIRRFTIDKGKAEKLYYPDYVVIVAGLPVLIVEAKSPGEDLDNAYREARLYATELNSQFGHGINPCTWIIATDGMRTVCGHSDSSKYEFDLSFDEIEVSNVNYSKFTESLCKERLRLYAKEILSHLRTRDYFRPVNLLGGATVANEEFSENGFGIRLSTEFRHLFNPKTQEDRIKIVKHAYVRSRRRDQYVNPIDTIIRAAVPASVSTPVHIKDTQNPMEIIESLRGVSELEREVLLLVGSVGSGKSTFVDHLKEVALPTELRKKTVWLHLNLNDAPLDERAYEWVSERLIDGFKCLHKRTDFDDPDVQEKIYSVEIGRLRRVAAKYLEPDSPKLKEVIFEKLVELQGDVKATATAMSRYYCAEKDKALIVVLDNCDKQKREQQLFMFQVAQWVKEQFRCLVFLPIRDVTYENHHREPPLDTALKNLVFRIDPPSITEVLRKRIDLAFQQMKKNTNEKFLQFELANGIKVEYPQTEQAFYLACILKSLFEYDKIIRRVLIGLAGDDVRRAMEIFLEFCTSGHIDEAEILKMQRSKGDYALDFHVVTRVLLRMNRRYYDGDKSYLKNLFQCDPKDARPDHLVRYMILRWLLDRLHAEGPSGVEGFHKVSAILRDLISFGHDAERVRTEILRFVKAGCIVPESQNEDALTDDDLIRLSSSGEVHLALFENLDYIAACSEDVWYSEEQVAERIKSRIRKKHYGGHYQPKTILLNAMDLVDYMEVYVNSLPDPQVYLTVVPPATNGLFSAAHESIHDMRKSLGISPKWDDVETTYPVGKIVTGKVASVKDFGVFVELEPGFQGLLPKATVERHGGSLNLKNGSQIRVRVRSIKKHDFQMELDFAKIE